LRAPPSMISRVREIFNGEYDIPYSHQSPVTVDIGANIGGFAAWASQRWPGSVIHCYEPLPQNFELEFWRGTGNLACENRNHCQMRFSVHTTRKPAAPPDSICKTWPKDSRSSSAAEPCRARRGHQLLRRRMSIYCWNDPAGIAPHCSNRTAQRPARSKLL